MRVLIAMDSFKGSFSSLEAAAFVERGIKRADPEAECRTVAVADGGEGVTRAIMACQPGREQTLTVQGPLAEPVRAMYGVVTKSRELTAVMEMAEASGLNLVEAGKRDVLAASSFGTGQMIAHALEQGCRRFILGLGGSATNDGGAGMAAALGIRFLDEAGAELPPGGGHLGKLDRIDCSGVHPRLGEASFVAACDVNNPLCGPQGASVVYGPQKGATPEMVALLDGNLRHYAQILERDLGCLVAERPGAGAAGGLGAGLLAFCDAQLQKGIDVVLEAVGFDELAVWADLVITGEGRLDGQTVFGKTPVGVALGAKRHGKPVLAIAGSLGPGARDVLRCGIDGIESAVVAPVSLEEAIRQSPDRIADAAERLMHMVVAIRN